ncbi:MAG: TolC family protein [Gemmatimonadaceae bacterium]|nr:TolC family protein [Gemmatimonadaceae bacterium]
MSISRSFRSHAARRWAALLVATALSSTAPHALAAQAPDTLQLSALQDAAVQRDPRAGQRELLRDASALRLTTLDMERRPQLALNGSASHQSDVTQLLLKLPNATMPVLPKDRWQTTLDVSQLLYDGGSIAARQSVERARVAESAAAVDATLYRLRGEVNGAFFSAYLLQERAQEFDALLGDLDARLQLARARVINGAALPRDTSAIVAEQLRSRMARDEALSARRASVAVLERLTGRTIADGTILALPDYAADVDRTRSEGRVDALRARPEFAQFARTRERIDREAALTNVENRPRVLAFGQGGVGRPGLNQFRTDPDGFWMAGVRVEWRPWTWRGAQRAAEGLRLQQRIVTTEERALAEQLARAVESDLADMQRVRDALASDAQLVTLRQSIEVQARAQFNEGAITGAEYVETRTDVVEATLQLQRHRAELAQAQARYLTTLGLAPRSLQP